VLKRWLINFHEFTTVSLRRSSMCIASYPQSIDASSLIESHIKCATTLRVLRDGKVLLDFNDSD
jgi:hypothetical protein